MKKLQKSIIWGIYNYFSKQFNIITELSDSWEVTMGVEVDGKIVELITITADWANEVGYTLDDFEATISDNLERLKSKYILNHHHRQAA